MFSLRSASLVPALLAFGGCTLLLGYGDEVELARDAGTSDAPAIAADASGADVADDRPFCARQSPRPTFCASFDGPAYLSEWQASVSNNARLDRDTTSFVSGPASLRISLDRKDDGMVTAGPSADFAAWADRPFSVAIGFDIQIEAAAPLETFVVMASPIVMFVPTRATYLIQFTGRLLADGSTVAVSIVEVTMNPEASREHPSALSLQVGKWAHVDLTMALAGSNNAARLAIDGAVGFEAPLALTAGGTPSTSFGLATVSADTTTWTYRFDNVTLDFR